jgi:hypothetical protein
VHDQKQKSPINLGTFFMVPIESAF